MDEQRAWIKSRRKKRLRLLAAALTFCLLITTYPDILATLSAFAAGMQGGDGTVYVSGFESLPEEVREQTVPLGTEIEEQTLPSTLEAFVTITEERDAPDKEENPDAPGPKEEGTVGGAGTGSVGTGTETGGGSTGTGGNTENGSTGTGGGIGTDGGSTETGNTDTGSNGTEESGSSTGGTDTEQETPSDTGSTASEIHTEETDHTEAQEKSAPEESEETHTVTQPEYQSGPALTIETLEAPSAGESDKTDADAAASETSS